MPLSPESWPEGPKVINESEPTGADSEISSQHTTSQSFSPPFSSPPLPYPPLPSLLISSPFLSHCFKGRSLTDYFLSLDMHRVLAPHINSVVETGAR